MLIAMRPAGKRIHLIVSLLLAGSLWGCTTFYYFAGTSDNGKRTLLIERKGFTDRNLVCEVLTNGDLNCVRLKNATDN